MEEPGQDARRHEGHDYAPANGEAGEEEHGEAIAGHGVRHHALHRDGVDDRQQAMVGSSRST